MVELMERSLAWGVAALCIMMLAVAPSALAATLEAAPSPAASSPGPSAASPPASPDAAPKTRTIAYFEAGPYWEFSLLYDEVLKSLERRGVRELVTVPDRLVVSPGWGKDKDVYRAEARKLMADPSIDLIISMGTEATAALLAENNGRTPIVSMDVADPVGAGIVDQVTGKGPENLTIYYVRDKWFRVFELFHMAVPFKRLGILYHDSPEGLQYSNVREARELARERGFELVEYNALDKGESLETCQKGVDYLMEKGIDAFYISALVCFDWTQSDPQPIIRKLHDAGIPTFARDGSVQVRHGAFMGLSTLDYRPLGEINAYSIGRILSLIPADAPMPATSYKPRIALNLQTASELKADVSLLLLLGSDEVFDASLEKVRDVKVAR